MHTRLLSTLQRHICALFSAVMAAGFLGGCESPRSHALVASYRANNIYRASDTLPASMKRVAVLPVTVETGDWQADAGRESFEPMLRSELGRLKAFEAVFVTPEQMRDWTGATTLKAGDRLPPALFELLIEVTGCEGVLFSHVRPFHAYKPLVIGWQFKLIESRGPRILWAADEVFDASDPAVATAAERYWRGRAERASDAGEILSSPRRFSQYTLGILFSTLPQH